MSRVFFSQPQNVQFQAGVHGEMGHESLVNVPHHGRHLAEEWGRL